MRNAFAAEGNLSQDTIMAFGGYTHLDVTSWGNMYETKNLSTDLYPVLSNRKPRGIYREQALTKPNGLYWKDGLMWADGTSLYFNGELVGTVTDTEKKFAGMGAYIIIFPDKKIFSTEDKSLKNMEVTWTGQVDFTTSSIVFPSSVTPSKLGFDQYDGVTISGSQYAENNTTPIIYEIRDSDYELAESAGEDEKANSFYFTPNIFHEESNVTITIKREVPDMDYIVESDNRIWGCKDHEIYASALGAPSCWNRFEGISQDSYAVTVGSESTFTGAGVELGYVIFFKEDTFHKIYGTKPSNFSAMPSTLRGVAEGSDKSVEVVDEVLWYLSKDGVMAYGGATPESVAGAFGTKHFENGVGGGIDGKYYISMQDENDEWGLYAYDIDRQLWIHEDGTHALFMTSSGRALYYIDAADNKIKTISGDSAETVEWEAEFGDICDGTPAFKQVVRLYLNLWLDEGASCKVSLRYQSDGEWEEALTLTGDETRRTRIVPIYTRRYTQIAMKLSGTGNFKLFGMTRVLEPSTELGSR